MRKETKSSLKVRRHYEWISRRHNVEMAASLLPEICNCCSLRRETLTSWWCYCKNAQSALVCNTYSRCALLVCWPLFTWQRWARRERYIQENSPMYTISRKKLKIGKLNKPSILITKHICLCAYCVYIQSDNGCWVFIRKHGVQESLILCTFSTLLPIVQFKISQCGEMNQKSLLYQG